MVYLDEKAIQQLIEAFNQRDWGPGSKLFTEDAILHCPGKNRVSGDHQGKQGIIEFWLKQFEIAGDSFQAEVLSVCQGEGNLVLVMYVQADHDGQTYSWRRVNHYRIVEGRVVEGWIYEGDQYTADIVFS
jgi:predicted SnoaL-like aldol condensation-catalyzing enzyme